MAREILLLTFSYIGCNLRERVRHNREKGRKKHAEERAPPGLNPLRTLRNCFLR